MFWTGAPVLFVLFWAGGYSFAKLGLPYIEPMTMLAIRYGLAVLCLLPLLILFKPALPRDPTHWAVMAASGFLIQCVYFGLAYQAMKQGLGAGTTAIVMALQPALVAALSPLVGEKRGRPVMWLGLALGFAGVAVCVFDRASAVPLSAGLLAVSALFGLTAATSAGKTAWSAQRPGVGRRGAICGRLCRLAAHRLCDRDHAGDLAPGSDPVAGLSGGRQFPDFHQPLRGAGPTRRRNARVHSAVSGHAAGHCSGLADPGRTRHLAPRNWLCSLSRRGLYCAAIQGLTL